MEKIKPGMFYIAVDGDSIGAKVGRAVLANDIEELHKVSARIDAAQDFILHWCKDVDGIKISGGGDEATMAVPKDALSKIQGLRKSIEKSFGYTISVGVGKSLSEAATSLLVAKIRGKDRVVYYSKKIEDDIKKAKRRVREKRASVEENKLAEAYLSKAEDMKCKLHKNEPKNKHSHKLHKHEEGFHNGSADSEDKCPYCADNEDNRTDDCAYCQDLDAQENADGTAGMNDCEACNDYDAENQNTGGIEGDDCPYCQDVPNEVDGSGGIDGCPYCESETVGEAEAGTPEGQDVNHICNCPNCPKRDATALGVEDMGAESPDNCPQCQEMYGDAIEEQPGQTAQEDPNLQGHETAEEVLDLLDQKPGEGSQTPEAEAKKIDNTELPQGDEMDGNISVPEDFGDKQEANISDSEKDMQDSDHECNCPDCPGSQNQDSPIDRMASPDYQGTQGDADQMAQEQAPEVDQDPAGVEGQDEPDMAEVLQGGLNDHADEQKKAQVLDMVGQTLAGFKANKASLEATKEQNQPLYNSCIQMLKSMIELCKLLGLQPQMTATPEATPQPGQDAPIQDQAKSSEGQTDPKAVG